VMMQVMGTPNWASELGDQSAAEQQKWADHASTFAPKAEHDAGFAKFFGEVVKRYSAQGIHDYEFWNEPGNEFWRDTWANPKPNPEHYTRLLKQVYEAAHSADAEANVIAGGMPLEKTVSDEWQALTGNVIVEGYGLTETSPLVSVNHMDTATYNGTIGYPMPGTDVTLRDDNGAIVPLGEPGEMWVRGPQVMQGYWQHPDETRRALQDGWLKTGDIAVMRPDGALKIVDRKKDMILVSGFNVYPSEVEAVLAQHPAVLEVACIGVPSEGSGEKVKACVVARPGKKLTMEELQKFANAHLTAYKRPKVYEFCDDLPKSNVGKILKRELVAREKAKAKG